MIKEISQQQNLKKQFYTLKPEVSFDTTIIIEDLTKKHLYDDFGRKCFLTIAKNYELSNFKIVYQNVSQVNVQTIRLQYNMCNYIIKDIQSINYPNLIHLVLASNKIDNFQALMRIEMPNLQILNLCWNFVSNLKCFNKNSYKLKSLWLHCNQIVHIQKFSRFCQTQKFDNLTLDRNQINNFAQIFKLKHQTILKLNQRPNSNIQTSENIHQMFKKCKVKIN